MLNLVEERGNTVVKGTQSRFTFLLWAEGGRKGSGGELHTRFVLRLNSGTPIRLQYLQLMHSFGVATSVRVYNTSQSSKCYERLSNVRLKS